MFVIGQSLGFVIKLETPKQPLNLLEPGTIILESSRKTPTYIYYTILKDNGIFENPDTLLSPSQNKTACT